jgi:ATP-dependent protease ClpP protease subunit/phage major head subunit gpT-like protein
MPNKWYEIKALAKGAVEVSIYDEIGMWGVSAKDFKSELDLLGNINEITFAINSPGGSVIDGIAMHNLAKNLKAKTIGRVDGIAASMASYFLTAMDEVHIPENALIMIHNPHGPAYGDADEIESSAATYRKMQGLMIAAYSRHLAISEDETAALMKAETWYTGIEAVEAGFATKLLDEVKLAASFDKSKLDQFTNKTILKTLATASKTTGEVIMTTKEKSALIAEGKVVADPVAFNKIDAAAVSVQAIADFKASEATRKQGIRTAFGSFAEKHSGMLTGCIEDMECTVEKAREQLLAKLGEKAEPSFGGFTANLANVSNGSIVKESMVAAIKGRANIKLEDNELTRDNPFRMMSMSEMARAALEHKGVGVSAYGDRMALVGAAFTHSSSDFGSILADVANKAMLKGYENADETFQQWTSTGQLSDFKVNKRVALNSFPSLRKVQPGAEYKYATVGDRGEDIVLATYGEIFSITRQAIINDDLSAFTRIPASMGRAAIRTIGDLVYAILTGNPDMSDDVSLFHADHNNYATGTSSSLGVVSVSAGRTAMKLQKDGSDNVLNIMPQFLLVPAALELDADSLMTDTVYPGKTNGQKNPIAGMATTIADPRLDAASTTAWYLAASQAFDTIEVAYLDGNSSPFIDQIEGWSVDGTSMKVRIDAGVSPLDFRTMYKSKGAA